MRRRHYPNEIEIPMPDDDLLIFMPVAHGMDMPSSMPPFETVAPWSLLKLTARLLIRG
jgi:hypothetical protein